ncbi:MAG: preprotein translocase subunit SecY [Clostridiales bacterium]|nr:preprotein translocase subunit SecY [Clostridiales bacterium]
MLKVLINAWKVKDLRSKILYTLMIFAILRLGTCIALPGIDVVGIKSTQAAANVGTLYNIISGGANSRWSIFAMGIGPYINSSIIMQLLTVAIPKLEQLNKEGQEGRKKIQNITRYLTVVLGLIQGIGITLSYRQLMINPGILQYVICVLALMAGTTFVMWLAEQITAKGVGNGSSLIIFINIVSSLPIGIRSLYQYGAGSDASAWLKVAGMLAILLVLIVFIIFVHDGERRLPVQYSAKMVGRRTFGGQSTFMPIKVNTAGVISIIFAISLLQFPETIAQFLPNVPTGLQKVIDFLRMTNPAGAVIYIVLIFFFTYFYTSIVVNANEIAENMKKSGGFILGIRPGQPTSAYISRVLSRITLVGAVCYSILAMVPIVMQWVFKMNIGFGGTTMIIVVGVCLDIVKNLESQLLLRHYKGFLNH